MQSVVAVILGGGRGTRLYPLTKNRAKPSVPIAGKFRLIDIPMSNCIHSGLDRIFILTQFNSASLNRHIAQTYHFGGLSDKSVRILAAQQTFSSDDWYQGTADAVRQNLHYFADTLNASTETEHVLILAGDHLYRMDYRQMIGFHLVTEADITVGAVPVPREQASRFGVMKTDADGRVTEFVEKPQTDAELDGLSSDGSPLVQHIPNAVRKPYLASMGIYVFKRDVLVEKLQDKANEDFGKDILPKSIDENAVYAFPFDGYWEDIGTIRSFYDANLGLLDTVPQFNFYDESHPVYTYRYNLPSTKVNQSQIFASILAEGAIIDRSEIVRSILGLRSIVRSDTRIERSIVMGADFYESAEQIAQHAEKHIPAMGIGRNCLIRNAIIDKNARVGDGTKLTNERGVDNFDADDYCIRDGIIVVAKNGVIPAGTLI